VELTLRFKFDGPARHGRTDGLNGERKIDQTRLQIHAGLLALCQIRIV